MSALSDAAWEVAGRNETVLILAHPCGGTRHACEHLRDSICAADATDDERTRRIVHEGNPLPNTVVNISYRHFPGGAVYESFDHVWHLVRDPLEHVFSASFKTNIDSLWLNLKLPDQGYTRKRLANCGCRSDKGEHEPFLREALVTLAEYNRQAALVATARFRVEDLPGERDENHVHVRGPRNLPTWNELRKLDEGFASMLYQQWITYGYGAKYFDDPQG